MARVTLASQAIIIAQLEAQVAELTTEKGILLSEVTMLQSELVTSKEVIARQSIVIAAQPKSAPPALPKKPAPKPLPAHAEVATPVINITDADRSIYAKFKALPREQRLAIIEFARPQFGNVGIDNIIRVRAAWHEFQQPVDAGYEAHQAEQRQLRLDTDALCAKHFG